MKFSITDVKTALEIAAYICGVLFIITKLIGGQANAGMEVSIELGRAASASQPEVDNLSILLKLKRPDLGRIELEDVAIEVSDAFDSASEAAVLRVPRVISERRVDNGQVTLAPSSRGITLPPSDATQIAYITQVKRGVPIFVDATIVGTRTGLWVGKPQWRASAIALPVHSAASTGGGKAGA